MLYSQVHDNYANFFQTLDLLEALCDQYGYKHCRLDGSTPSARRVDIVNKFNSPYSTNRKTCSLWTPCTNNNKAILFQIKGERLAKTTKTLLSDVSSAV